MNSSASSAQLEAFLARLYVDAHARANFKSNPRAAAKNAGLSEDQWIALESLDWIGLEMAARSFAKKRHQKRRPTWFAAIKTRLSRFRFFRPTSGFVCRGNLKCKKDIPP